MLHSLLWIVISELQLAEHDVAIQILLHVDIIFSGEITMDLSHIKIIIQLSQMEKKETHPKLQTENDMCLHTTTEYGEQVIHGTPELRITIIYGDEVQLQIQMRIDSDHVLNDIMCQIH